MSNCKLIESKVFEFWRVFKCQSYLKFCTLMILFDVSYLSRYVVNFLSVVLLCLLSLFLMFLLSFSVGAFLPVLLSFHLLFRFCYRAGD